MPDVNSLPASYSPSTNQHPSSPLHANSQGTTHSPAQRSPAMQNRNSPTFRRRRSSMLGSWNLNDGSGRSSPTTADPHHQRTASLGELHQELENEQEAQVNRLLGLIRQQQAQIDSYESALPHQQHGTDEASASARPRSRTPSRHAVSRQTSGSRPTSFVAAGGVGPVPRTSNSLSRQSSHRSSMAGSPLLGSPALREHHAALDRDEVSYLQAETQAIVRENHMLKGRIRELEQMVAAARGGGGGGGAGAAAA